MVAGPSSSKSVLGNITAEYRARVGCVEDCVRATMVKPPIMEPNISVLRPQVPMPTSCQESVFQPAGFSRMNPVVEESRSGEVEVASQGLKLPMSHSTSFEEVHANVLPLEISGSAPRPGVNSGVSWGPPLVTLPEGGTHGHQGMCRT